MSLSPCESSSLVALVRLIYRGLLKGHPKGGGGVGMSLSPCESSSLAALVRLIYRGLLKGHPSGENHRIECGLPQQCSNKFGIVFGLHYCSLYAKQAAPQQCSNKFGIVFGLHYFCSEKIHIKIYKRDGRGLDVGRDAAARACGDV